MFASFRDLSGVYAEDDDYYGHDTGAGTLNDIYEAYGYGDEYSDGHFSDGEDIRNFWFGNGSAECAEDAEQTETDDVADPSIEEIDSVEEEPPQSARLLLGTFSLMSFSRSQVTQQLITFASQSITHQMRPRPRTNRPTRILSKTPKSLLRTTQTSSERRLSTTESRTSPKLPPNGDRLIDTISTNLRETRTPIFLLSTLSFLIFCFSDFAYCLFFSAFFFSFLFLSFPFLFLPFLTRACITMTTMPEC